jgi:hypothetical protein
MWSVIVRWFRGVKRWLSVDPDRASWLRTSALGRATTGVTGALLAALTLYVKFSGIREWGVVDPAPFLILAIGKRDDPKLRVDFLMESIAMIPVAVFLEIEDAWWPTHNDTFDPWDLVAAFAGALVAFTLLRLLVRRRS